MADLLKDLYEIINKNKDKLELDTKQKTVIDRFLKNFKNENDIETEGNGCYNYKEVFELELIIKNHGFHCLKSKIGDLKRAIEKLDAIKELWECEIKLYDMYETGNTGSDLYTLRIKLGGKINRYWLKTDIIKPIIRYIKPHTGLTIINVDNKNIFSDDINNYKEKIIDIIKLENFNF